MTKQSRVGAAFMAGAIDAKEKLAVPTSSAKSGGNWSRMAIEEMEIRLREARGDLATAHEVQYQGILEGRIPIAIPVDQIVDEVGTDRITSSKDGEDGDSFASLKENIKARGLRVPIRVRPQNTAWRPDPSFPRKVDGEVFVLQSGRRRLAACRDLGIKPMAFLSFYDDTEETRLSDLHERFFENVLRKNLTASEKLYSIGLITQEMPSLPQSELAKILGVAQASISRGMAVLQFYDRLSKDLDLATASIAEIEGKIKLYRVDQKSQTPRAVKQRAEREQMRSAKKLAPGPLPFTRRRAGASSMVLASNARGMRTLTITGKMSDETIDQIAEILEGQGT